jgi:hypothetical protein
MVKPTLVNIPPTVRYGITWYDMIQTARMLVANQEISFTIREIFFYAQGFL